MMAASPIPSHLASVASASQSTPRPARTRPTPSPGSSPAPSAPSPRQGSPRSSSPRNQSGPSGLLDVEAVLRSNGGDLEKALEQIIAERNTLQQQNSQLWKLIEKQRSQCAHLVHDNERLRADRERASARLVGAGMEPVNGKRIPHSSSSIGLGLGVRGADGSPAALGAIRRNNSDRDERIVASVDRLTPGLGGGPSSSLQVPSADSSATSSPSEPPPTLLPSPMAERGERGERPEKTDHRAEQKSRRESRMAFAPEVRSFLSLADSPRNATHPVPPIPGGGGVPPRSASMSSATPTQTPIQASTPSVEVSDSSSSPGSTYSPSPAAVKREIADPSETPGASQALATMAEVQEEPDSEQVQEVELASPPRAGERAVEPPQRQSSLHRRAGPGREQERERKASQVTDSPRATAEATQQYQSPNPSQSRTIPTQVYAPPETPPVRASAGVAEPRRSQDSNQQSDDTTPRQSIDRRDLPSYRPSLDPAATPTSSSSSRPSRPLPRLSPSLLPHTRLSIPHTTVHPNAVGRDVLCFIVAVTVRPPNAAPVTWNVAKLFSAFIDLDTNIRAKSGKRSKDWKAIVAPLPDGKAWKDFAPSKIDQRKMALEAYLQSLLVAPLSDKSDLCEFLSTDPVQAKVFSSRKEGYLTKKGKSFGGWRTRYFVLEGSVLECYENRGGPHHSSILITNAQIGRQNRASESAEDRESRHAFLIIEQSKKGPQRHILCAESDLERDSWIEALVRFVDPDAAGNPPSQHIQALSPQSQPQPQPQPPTYTTTAPPSSTAHQIMGLATSTSAPQVQGGITRRRSNSRKSSRDVVVTAAQPLSAMAMPMSGGNSKFAGAPSPSLINSMENNKAGQMGDAHGNRAGSGAGNSGFPGLSQPDHRNGHNGHSPDPTTAPSMPQHPEGPSSAEPAPPIQTSRQSKRQSMIPSRSSTSTHSLGPPPSHSAAYLSKLSSEGLNAPPGVPPVNMDKDRERKAKSGRFWPSFGKTPASSSSSSTISRPVFAVPLNESLAVASVASLPAIVFRCIEYLEAKRAEQEEGIYRLSGSSAVIKGLRDRFDAEGDVNLLLVDENWDPHAIAGLLKSFLRELPLSLLTRELHPRFLAVMDSSARVSELSRLVSELPPPNYALLRALTAHLILIVKHAQTNKMTLRNIGIVFSPTLGIPAGIFSELVSHFGAIFDDEPEEPEEAVAMAGQQGHAGDGDGGQGGEETVGRKRNSMLYQQGGADTLLGLGGRALDTASDVSIDVPPSPDPESDVLSGRSSENLSATSHGDRSRSDHHRQLASSR